MKTQKQIEKVDKYEFTFDYAMSAILSGNEVVKCPFGSLNNNVLSSLRSRGFVLNEIQNDDYRGKKYFVEKFE